VNVPQCPSRLIWNIFFSLWCFWERNHKFWERFLDQKEDKSFQRNPTYQRNRTHFWKCQFGFSIYFLKKGKMRKRKSCCKLRINCWRWKRCVQPDIEQSINNCTNHRDIERESLRKWNDKFIIQFLWMKINEWIQIYLLLRNWRKKIQKKSVKWVDLFQPFGSKTK